MAELNDNDVDMKEIIYGHLDQLAEKCLHY